MLNLQRIPSKFKITFEGTCAFGRSQGRILRFYRLLTIDILYILQESTKQLTMKKLPIVASFHLKRFEHSTKLHKKISTPVAFPEHLDMTPFVSHQRNNKKPSSKTTSPSYTSSAESSCEMLGSNMYTLFAVINHIGNIEAGHYTSFVRQYRDKWYRCNDHQIVPATIKEVLQSEGYLLFYHKQILEYQ